MTANTPHSSNMHLKQKCIFKSGHHLPACFSQSKLAAPCFACLGLSQTFFFFPPTTFWPYGSWRNKRSIISSNRIWWQHANHKRHGLVRRLSNSECDCLNQSLDQNAICCLDEPQRLRFGKNLTGFLLRIYRCSTDDTAQYTVVASNLHGQASSQAALLVKSKSSCLFSSSIWCILCVKSQ